MKIWTSLIFSLLVLTGLFSSRDASAQYSSGNNNNNNNHSGCQLGPIQYGRCSSVPYGVAAHGEDPSHPGQCYWAYCSSRNSNSNTNTRPSPPPSPPDTPTPPTHPTPPNPRTRPNNNNNNNGNRNGNNNNNRGGGGGGGNNNNNGGGGNNNNNNNNNNNSNSNNCTAKKTVCSPGDPQDLSVKGINWADIQAGNYTTSVNGSDKDVLIKMEAPGTMSGSQCVAAGAYTEKSRETIFGTLSGVWLFNPDCKGVITAGNNGLVLKTAPTDIGMCNYQVTVMDYPDTYYKCDEGTLQDWPSGKTLRWKTNHIKTSLLRPQLEQEFGTPPGELDERTARARELSERCREFHVDVRSTFDQTINSVIEMAASAASIGERLGPELRELRHLLEGLEGPAGQADCANRLIRTYQAVNAASGMEPGPERDQAITQALGQVTAAGGACGEALGDRGAGVLARLAVTMSELYEVAHDFEAHMTHLEHLLHELNDIRNEIATLNYPENRPHRDKKAKWPMGVTVTPNWIGVESIPYYVRAEEPNNLYSNDGRFVCDSIISRFDNVKVLTWQGSLTNSNPSFDIWFTGNLGNQEGKMTLQAPNGLVSHTFSAVANGPKLEEVYQYNAAVYHAMHDGLVAYFNLQAGVHDEMNRLNTALSAAAHSLADLARLIPPLYVPAKLIALTQTCETVYDTLFWAYVDDATERRMLDEYKQAYIAQDQYAFDHFPAGRLAPACERSPNAPYGGH